MRTVFLRRGLVALFAAAVSFGAITQAQAESLRIGYQKYGTLVLLKAKGTLEKRLAEQGVQVQWTEFPGGPQLLEGLNVGSIDFGVTGETPPVFAQAAGADLLYVAYEPPAPHSEAILVPKGSPIQSVKELKGKKVALNKGSNVHYLLVPRPARRRPQVQRHPARLPATCRCPRRLRARQRRCLGDLGPVPGGRRATAAGPYPA
jgi:ABC-type nitrate/sulfonate/bicarbonate transport systems, periplasmic components